MINGLVKFAKIFLVIQVTVGATLFGVLILILGVTGSVTMWQIIAMAGGGFSLLAAAGFAAVLFQISDRLAELIAQGETKSQLQGVPTGEFRREPTLRSTR